MLRIRQLASAAVFAVCTFLAHSALAASPVIASATLNAAATQVTIRGINFGPGAPTVILASTSLTIISQSATQIVANLPAGLAAGTYTLIVQIGKAGNSDRFAFAFGGAGPLRVLDSAGKQVGYNFDGESVLVPISGFPPVRLPVRISGFVENFTDLYYASTNCSEPAFLFSDPDLLVLDQAVVAVFGGKIYVPTLSAGPVTLQSARFGGACSGPFTYQTEASPVTVIPISSLGFTPPFSVAP